MTAANTSTRDRGSATQPPSARRLQAARRRGQVPLSAELVAAASLAAGVLALVATLPAGAGKLLALARVALSMRADHALSSSDVAQAGFDTVLAISVVPLGALVAGVVIAGLAQTGGILAPVGWFGAGGGRGWFASGGRNRAAGDRVFDGLRGGLRVVMLAAILGWALAPVMPGILRLAGAPPSSALALVGAGALRLGMGATAGALLLAVGDLIVVHLRHRRELRMTPDEVRRELRETEGDPRLKAERHRLYRQGAGGGGARDVREADFVVLGHWASVAGAHSTPGEGSVPGVASGVPGAVDADGVAIAVRYAPERADAPLVVAKGTGIVAAHVRALAAEAAVPVFEDDALANLLATVADGGEIPPSGHQAAAEMLLRAWRHRGVKVPDGAAREAPARR